MTDEKLYRIELTAKDHKIKELEDKIKDLTRAKYTVYYKDFVISQPKCSGCNWDAVRYYKFDSPITMDDDGRVDGSCVHCFTDDELLSELVEEGIVDLIEELNEQEVEDGNKGNG